MLTPGKIAQNSFFDELNDIYGQEKFGYDRELDAALSRVETLEKNKPTVKQVARYGALGAASAPIIKGIGDAVAGKPILGSDGGYKGIIRNVASSALTGALSSGAIPLIRSHLDRQSEVNNLKHIIKNRLGSKPGVAGQPQVKQKFSSLIGNTPADSWDGSETALKYASFCKIAGGAITPKGRLSQSRAVGLPKVTAPPGPEINDVVPTFGKTMPGTHKDGIGKRSDSFNPPM